MGPRGYRALKEGLAKKNLKAKGQKRASTYTAIGPRRRPLRW
jgi:hypothetical protein